MEATGWFGFDDLFWLTLLVIFVSALLASLAPLYRTSRCLKLFDDYHVTYMDDKGHVRWGDLRASSLGLEVVYDATFVTSRGIKKTSALIFEDEMTQCLAIARTLHGLTEDEFIAREQQIRQTFNPPLWRRLRRKVRNFLGLLQDAFTKSFSVAATTVSGRMGTALQKQKSEVGDISSTLTGVMGNAYEPLLERLIGKSVVLECATGPGAIEPVAEFTGYLVEYSERYLALFSIEHGPVEQLELDVTESQEFDGFSIELNGDRCLVRCVGPDALVVQTVFQDSRSFRLDLTLLPGCTHEFRIEPGAPLSLTLEKTYQLDLICPRGKARIRYASDAPLLKARGQGLAPE